MIPWTAAHPASLSFTISQSLPQLISIESVMPFNLFPLCHPLSSCLQSFPASGSFLSLFLSSGGQSIGTSALTSILLMNIQYRFPLGLTRWISLQSKRLSSLLQYHNSKASLLWHSAFFAVQLSRPYMTTGKAISSISGLPWCLKW